MTPRRRLAAACTAQTAWQACGCRGSILNEHSTNTEGAPTMSALETPAPRPADVGHVLGEGERGGLPWWTYFNAELLEIEKDRLFRRCWQLVGHVNDIPDPGAYLT